MTTTRLKAGTRVRVTNYPDPQAHEGDINGHEGVVVEHPDPVAQATAVIMGVTMVDMGPEFADPRLSGMERTWLLRPSEFEVIE